MEIKLPKVDLVATDAIFYTNILILTTFLLIFGFFTYVLYRTFKTEKKRKEYTPTMKKGDIVYTPVMSGDIKGEILEVNDDKVKIIIEVSKSRIYPEN